MISCDDSVGCNGGESVGLLKGNRVDKNEVFVLWPRRDFYYKAVSCIHSCRVGLTYLVPAVTKSILLPRPFRKNRGHSSVSRFSAIMCSFRQFYSRNTDRLFNRFVHGVGRVDGLNNNQCSEFRMWEMTVKKRHETGKARTRKSAISLRVRYTR